jgi:hypothetical protein
VKLLTKADVTDALVSALVYDCADFSASVVDPRDVELLMSDQPYGVPGGPIIRVNLYTGRAIRKTAGGYNIVVANEPKGFKLVVRPEPSEALDSFDAGYKPNVIYDGRLPLEENLVLLNTYRAFAPKRKDSPFEAFSETTHSLHKFGAAYDVRSFAIKAVS